MGVKIFDIVEKRNISIASLKGKRIAVDAHLFLHQFLTSIRQYDGRPLTNSKGQITSHLVGLFSRTVKLLQEGLLLCYVFDGRSPALKQSEIERRKRMKEESKKKYLEAIKTDDVELMRKFASRSVHLTPTMIEESKRLLKLLGVPIIQAPSEGEAQAAYMTKTNEVYAVASQDGDTLVFGGKRIIRNLAISGRRKRAGGLTTRIVRPEIIELNEVLTSLKITQNQLIVMAILIGTDFNPKGIPRIGQKKAIKLVNKFGENFDSLFNEVEWKKYWSFSWRQIFEIFTNIPTNEETNLIWTAPKIEDIKKMLIEQFEFSESRVKTSLSQLISTQKQRHQKGLSEFI